MVYTTKYSKNQPKKRVKKYSDGGYVDAEREIDSVAAKDRLDKGVKEIHDDIDTVARGKVYLKKNGREKNPELAIDTDAAAGRLEDAIKKRGPDARRVIYR